LVYGNSFTSFNFSHRILDLNVSLVNLAEQHIGHLAQELIVSKLVKISRDDVDLVVPLLVPFAARPFPSQLRKLLGNSGP
jgi:hypothetical protein